MSALTDIVNPGMSILNASTTYGTNDDTKKFPQSFLDAMALDSDAEVCKTFLETPGHPFRKGFIANTGALADNAVISISNATVYDVVNVQVDSVDAIRKPVTYFKRLASDPLSRTTIGKYFDIQDGNVIRHNGAAAVCKVVRFIIGSAPQAPDELRNATISCFLSLASSKMGVDIEAASYFAQQWMQRAQMIRGGAIQVPPVIAWQKMENER